MKHGSSGNHRFSEFFFFFFYFLFSGQRLSPWGLLYKVETSPIQIFWFCPAEQSSSFFTSPDFILHILHTHILDIDLDLD